MVVEHAYISVDPARRAEFEAAYAKAEPILAGAQGCTGTALFRDVERPGGYLLRVGWQRLADHLEVFPTSDAGRAFAAHVAGFFTGAPEVRHFEVESVGHGNPGE